MVILMSLTLLVLLRWPHYFCILGGAFLFPMSGMMHPAVICLCWGMQDDETKLCCSYDHFQTRILVILDTVWPVLLCN